MILTLYQTIFFTLFTILAYLTTFLLKTCCVMELTLLKDGLIRSFHWFYSKNSQYEVKFTYQWLLILILQLSYNWKSWMTWSWSCLDNSISWYMLLDICYRISYGCSNKHSCCGLDNHTSKSDNVVVDSAIIHRKVTML